MARQRNGIRNVLAPPGMYALLELKKALGSDFIKHVSAELRGEFEEWKLESTRSALQSMARLRETLGTEERTLSGIVAMLGQDVVQLIPDYARLVADAAKSLAILSESKTAEIYERALEGELEAIQWFLREDPVETLKDPEIIKHIESRAYSGRAADKHYLESVLRALRKGLLQPQPGRPRSAVPEMRELAETVQTLFEKAPVKRKKAYRSSVAKALDEKQLAQFIAAALPIKWQVRAVRAVGEVLSEHPKIRAGFGVAVVAKLFRCSSSLIRSMKKPS